MLGNKNFTKNGKDFFSFSIFLRFLGSASYLFHCKNLWTLAIDATTQSSKEENEKGDIYIFYLSAK
jgi:hypothetical protein